MDRNTVDIRKEFYMYIRNGIIKSLKQISVTKDGRRYYNVSSAMAMEDGWEVYMPPVSSAAEMSAEESYKQRIIELIRERYSLDDELAIQRQRDTKMDEFSEYHAYVESCKETARRELYGEEGA